MIYFTGDINLTDWLFNAGFGIGTNIAKGLDPFQDIERKEGDMWIGNFEGVASEITERKGIHAIAFRVNPDILQKLHHMDMYGFANNHAMEHGPDAYDRTVKALESYGSKVFGLKDRRSLVFYHKGCKCSISGMCLRVEATEHTPLYWYNPEFKEIEAEIESLPSDAYKILFVHWGNEYVNRPSSQQKKFAHWLIDAGFDLIIGMHPHVLQGYEDYNGGRIYYSIGNFVFDMASEPCKTGAVVGLDFNEGQPVLSGSFIRIDDKCCPHFVTEKEVPRQYRFDYLNEMLLIEDNSEEYHHEVDRGYRTYRKANHRYILKNIVRHPKFGIEVVSDFIRRRVLN